jgi:hypothetical protein
MEPNTYLYSRVSQKVFVELHVHFAVVESKIPEEFVWEFITTFGINNGKDMDCHCFWHLFFLFQANFTGWCHEVCQQPMVLWTVIFLESILKGRFLKMLSPRPFKLLNDVHYFSSPCFLLRLWNDFNCIILCWPKF